MSHSDHIDKTYAGDSRSRIQTAPRPQLRYRGRSQQALHVPLLTHAYHLLLHAHPQSSRDVRLHVIPSQAWQTTSPVRPPIRCTGGPLLAKLAGISRRLCRESPRDLFVLRAKQRKCRSRDSARPEKNDCRIFKKALSKLAMPLAQSRPRARRFLRIGGTQQTMPSAVSAVKTFYEGTFIGPVMNKDKILVHMCTP